MSTPASKKTVAEEMKCAIASKVGGPEGINVANAIERLMFESLASVIAGKIPEPFRPAFKAVMDTAEVAALAKTDAFLASLAAACADPVPAEEPATPAK